MPPDLDLDDELEFETPAKNKPKAPTNSPQKAHTKAPEPAKVSPAQVRLNAMSEAMRSQARANILKEQQEAQYWSRRLSVQDWRAVKVGLMRHPEKGDIRDSSDGELLHDQRGKVFGWDDLFAIYKAQFAHPSSKFLAAEVSLFTPGKPGKIDPDEPTAEEVTKLWEAVENWGSNQKFNGDIQFAYNRGFRWRTGWSNKREDIDKPRLKGGDQEFGEFFKNEPFTSFVPFFKPIVQHNIAKYYKDTSPFTEPKKIAAVFTPFVGGGHYLLDAGDHPYSAERALILCLWARWLEEQELWPAGTLISRCRLCLPTARTAYAHTGLKVLLDGGLDIQLPQK